MFRKILVVLGALALIGAAAFTFAPAPASANSYNNHRHYNHAWRPSIRFYNSPAYNSYGSCYVRRVVPTAFGPRVQWINVCY